ncbi:hypothetical protein K488DRAFT_84852 [Vararia minispora EC-137]|uniref:Uncharacterized protein n=1 Tax=Vararia minispora EC-137 TaxID=1314806 RepID=A0ACB8QP85_9AGAM|nr:hypothetical protein K488DRAFT_84852 [Vararia minispora EC-137]
MGAGHKLPNELLSLIFDFACGLEKRRHLSLDSPSIDPPLFSTLRLVCRTWQEVVDSLCPALYSLVPLQSRELTSIAIASSRTYPLILQAGLPLTKSVYEQTCTVVKEAPQRIETLNFSQRHLQPSLRARLPPPFYSTRFPSLKTVLLSHTDLSGVPFGPDQCPQLSVFQAFRCRVSKDHPVFASRLTVLRLEYSTCFSVHEVINRLKLLPSLEEFVWAQRCVAPRDSSEDFLPTPAALSRLRRLHLQGDMELVLDVVRSISAPALEKLKVDMNMGSSEEYSETANSLDPEFGQVFRDDEGQYVCESYGRALVSTSSSFIGDGRGREILRVSAASPREDNSIAARGRQVRRIPKEFELIIRDKPRFKKEWSDFAVLDCLLGPVMDALPQPVLDARRLHVTGSLIDNGQRWNEIAQTFPLTRKLILTGDAAISPGITPILCRNSIWAFPLLKNVVLHRVPNPTVSPPLWKTLVDKLLHMPRMRKSFGPNQRGMLIVDRHELFNELSDIWKDKVVLVDEATLSREFPYLDHPRFSGWYPEIS